LAAERLSLRPVISSMDILPASLRVDAVACTGAGSATTPSGLAPSGLA
jgi:hypothetical protein